MKQLINKNGVFFQAEENPDSIFLTEDGANRFIDYLIQEANFSLSDFKILTFVQYEMNQENISVNCPNCGSWEEQPSDQQRHHLQNFRVEWTKNQDEVEITILTCVSCNAEHSAQWINK